MAYTRTISHEPTLGVNRWSRRGRNSDPQGTVGPNMPHGAGLAFFFLLLFTALLFGRPVDFLPALKDVPLAQAVAICCALAYLVARLQGRAPLIWSLELKLVAALTVLFIAGLPFAFWRANTVEMLTTTWMKTLVIFFLMTQIVFTVERIRKLLWVIIIAEFLVALATLLDPRTQAMLAEDARLGGITRGILTGNYVGIAASTILPFIAVLLVQSRSLLKSLFLSSTFLLLMVMVVRTASRGGMIGVIVALVLVWALILRESLRARLLGVVFVIALLIAVAFAPDVFWERITTMWNKERYATSATAMSAGASEVQRKALLRRSIEYTIERPIFGLGLGNFSIRSGSDYGAQSWKGTHNTFTQVTAEAGLPAFAVFLALLVVAIRRMRQIGATVGDYLDGRDLRLLARATLVSLYAFMLSGVFAHLAYDFYLYYLIGFGVAIQSVSREHALGNLPQPEDSKRLSPRVHGTPSGRRALPR